MQVAKNSAPVKMCKAKTRQQLDADFWIDALIGCPRHAVVEVSETGTELPGGTPVCRNHQQQWINGHNYGRN